MVRTWTRADGRGGLDEMYALEWLACQDGAEHVELGAVTEVNPVPTPEEREAALSRGKHAVGHAKEDKGL